MTAELVLLIALYVFILLGGFIGDNGIISTFQDSTPKFASKLERNIAIGWRFENNNSWQ
jgi:hypothetical protein